jgi:hypothetical protein
MSQESGIVEGLSDHVQLFVMQLDQAAGVRCQKL